MTGMPTTAVPQIASDPSAKRHLSAACLFALGAFVLEAAGSVLHAVVLRDVPAELVRQGVTLTWMLRRDALIAVVAAAMGLLVWRMFRRAPSGGWRVAACGAGFALALEAVNWLLPGALLSPATPVQGIAAWIAFAGLAGVFAALASRRVATG